MTNRENAARRHLFRSHSPIKSDAVPRRRAAGMLAGGSSNDSAQDSCIHRWHSGRGATVTQQGTLSTSADGTTTPLT
jgi:hypothetical protein